jgi:hypothetical protein
MQPANERVDVEPVGVRFVIRPEPMFLELVRENRPQFFARLGRESCTADARDDWNQLGPSAPDDLIQESHLFVVESHSVPSGDAAQRRARHSTFRR